MRPARTARPVSSPSSANLVSAEVVHWFVRIHRWSPFGLSSGCWRCHPPPRAPRWKSWPTRRLRDAGTRYLGTNGIQRGGFVDRERLLNSLHERIAASMTVTPAWCSRPKRSTRPTSCSATWAPPRAPTSPCCVQWAWVHLVRWSLLQEQAPDEAAASAPLAMLFLTPVYLIAPDAVPEAVAEETRLNLSPPEAGKAGQAHDLGIALGLVAHTTGHPHRVSRRHRGAGRSGAGLDRADRSAPSRLSRGARIDAAHAVRAPGRPGRPDQCRRRIDGVGEHFPARRPGTARPVGRAGFCAPAGLRTHQRARLAGQRDYGQPPSSSPATGTWLVPCGR
jgi:hypothetical protein